MTKTAILCVDDEPIILNSLQEQLLRIFGNNYNIESAESGEEALEVIEELQTEGIEVALVISDQIMPGIKGDELLSIIHVHNPQIVKIMLTGQADIQALANAVNAANLYRYITKPWEAIDLSLTVKEALRCYTQQQQLAQQNQALQKLNTSLEQKVIERTVELTTTNNKLQQKIDERQLLEQNLKTSEGKLRAVFEAMTDIVLVINQQREIEVAPTNPEPLSETDTDPISATIKQFFLEERGEFWFSIVQKVLDTQKTINFDYTLPLGNSEVWFTANIAPMPNNSVIWVARNINERKLSEAAMEAAKEAAEAANLAKSTFLANMSHELRSPLNAILGFSQLLIRSQSLTTEQQENVSIINRSGENLLTLINNILDLSKIEAGRITLKPVKFDLYNLLNELEQIFEINSQDKGLQLVFHSTPDVPQYICTDQTKLRQVLINLLNNAIKFTKKGCVSLRVRRGDGEMGRWGNKGAEPTPNPSEEGNRRETRELQVNPPFPIPHSQITKDKGETTNNQQPTTIIFEVEDTGPGIAPGELESLFEAFVQTQTGKETQEGTGLGLPIARKFVQLMGGDITVSSKVGQGTIFQFDIQITTVDTTEIEAKQPTLRVVALEPKQPQYRILIVDDKSYNRQLLTKMLTPLGFETEEACNGKEAIEIWKTFEPHLIWMDMRMPVMNGYESTKQIKTHLKGQTTVIIALTASTLEEEQAVILSSGCDDFVRKPFREHDIFEKIAQYLGVRYLYEDLTLPPSEVILNDLSLQEFLTTMPTEWIQELYQAAELIDNEQIFKLVKQIPTEYAFLSQAIQHWVNGFRCDKIIDLIEAVRI